MAFHKNNFGVATHIVEPYADLNGFVPGLEDPIERFSYPEGHTYRTHIKNWEVFKLNAAGAIQMAQAAIDLANRLA